MVGLSETLSDASTVVGHVPCSKWRARAAKVAENHRLPNFIISNSLLILTKHHPFRIPTCASSTLSPVERTESSVVHPIHCFLKRLPASDSPTHSKALRNASTANPLAPAHSTSSQWK